MNQTHNSELLKLRDRFEFFFPFFFIYPQCSRCLPCMHLQNFFDIPRSKSPKSEKLNKSVFISGGSGPEFIGFRLACQPTFRVRVHRVSEVGKLSGLSGFRV